MHEKATSLLRALHVVAALCLLSVDAMAEPGGAGQAKEAFRRGVEAYAAQNPQAAAESFWEAFTLSPSGAAAFNAGVGWKDAGLPAKAAMAWEAALRVGGLTEQQRRQAEADLKALMKSVAKVRVEAPEDALVDVGDVTGGHPPVVTFLPHGDYEVRVLYPDGRVQTRLVALTDAGQVVRFEPPTQSPKGVDERGVNPVGGETPDRTEASSNGPWPWVAFGVATVSAGGAIWAGTRALSARDEYYESDFRDADARERAASYRTWTNVAWGAVGVSAGIGVYLLLSDGPSSTQATGKPFRAGISTAVNRVSFVAQF